MTKKLFALSLLASLAFMGCSDNSSSEDAGKCGNGVVDTGEACDGTELNGAVCPTGTTGTVTCTDTCTVDTTACTAVNPSASCGNSTLDAGEECDGTLFAAGKDVCPTGTTGTVACSSACTVDTTACVAADNTCGNGELDADEECDGDKFMDGAMCDEGAVGHISCTTDCRIDKTTCDTESTCGNGEIDADEECDGDNFADGKDVCPAGTNGSVTCDKTTCKVDTTACVATDNTCGNGEIDADEECDGEKFADGKDVCPDNKKGTVTCDKTTCKVITTECKAKTQEEICKEAGYKETCTEAEEGTFKCMDEKTLAMCESGCWMTEDCSVDGMVCNAEKQHCVGKCDKNVFSMGTGENVLTEDCTTRGQVCDEVAICVDPKDGIECDGTVLKIKGTDYSYDCKDNKNDMIACNTAHGCYDSYCKDNKAFMCSKEDGCLEVDDCSRFGNNNVICSETDTDAECVCKEEAEFCATLNDAAYFVYCTADGMDTEKCPNECNAEKGCYSKAQETGCGDGFVDKQKGETCDWYTLDGNPNSEKVFIGASGKKVDCNFYDSSAVYASGEAKCTDACKVDISECVKATAENFTVVKAYAFTSLDDIKNMTKTGVATMSGVFGTESNYDETDGGWSLGNWTDGATMGSYIEMQVGKVDYSNVRVTFNTRRTNDQKSPKSLQVKFLEDGKVVYTSSIVELKGTEKTAQTFDYKPKAGKMENMSFQFGAFNGNNGGRGNVVFSDIKVSGM